MNKTFDLNFNTNAKLTDREKKLSDLKEISAAVGEIKLRFDQFLNPNDVNNQYVAMQKGKQVAPAADNGKGANVEPIPEVMKADLIIEDQDGDVLEIIGPMQDDIYFLGQIIADLWLSLDNQRANFWSYVQQHAQGHLPPINSASQMEDALSALGLDRDYKVQPQTIYASDGSVKEIVVRFIPKKK